MFLWIYKREIPHATPHEESGLLLPYVMMTGAAFPAALAPVLGLEFGGVWIAAGAGVLVFTSLGALMDYIWNVPAWRLGALASVPVWLFVFVFSHWSPTAVLTPLSSEGPVIIIPISCGLSASLGALAALQFKG